MISAPGPERTRLRTTFRSSSSNGSGPHVDPDARSTDRAVALLRHPARRDVSRLALLLLEGRGFFDALAEDADALAAAGDFDGVACRRAAGGLAGEGAARVVMAAGRGVRGAGDLALGDLPALGRARV